MLEAFYDDHVVLSHLAVWTLLLVLFGLTVGAIRLFRSRLQLKKPPLQLVKEDLARMAEYWPHIKQSLLQYQQQLDAAREERDRSYVTLRKALEAGIQKDVLKIAATLTERQVVVEVLEKRVGKYREMDRQIKQAIEDYRNELETERLLAEMFQDYTAFCRI